MKKIVINSCYGGFGLSPKAIKMYLKLTGRECYFYNQTKYRRGDGEDKYVRVDNSENNLMFYCFTKDFGKTLNKFPDNKFYFSDEDIKRDDKNLVKVVESLGKEADGSFAELTIVEIPDDVDWKIEEYDGMESVDEAHRSWN